jgi:glycosyltransferase involved in cell wall biosynthesis
MKKKELKIFHGPNNITNTPRKLADLERARGHKSDSVNAGSVETNGPCHINGPRNKISSIFFRLKYMFLCMTYYQVINFHAGSSLLPFNLDLPLYKLFKRKVIFHYYGSEVRTIKELKEVNPYYKHLEADKKNSERKDFLKKIKMLWVSLWVYKAIAPKDVYFYVSNIFPQRKISNIWSANLLSTEFLEKIRSRSEQKLIPTIIHCPTNTATKGTEFVIKAVDNLAKKGLNFEFVLLENKDRSYVHDYIINKADIVLDQYLTGSFGNLCIESMAAGKVCSCYLIDTFHKNDKLPIVNTKIENLESSLESLILDLDKRTKISEESYQFIKTNLNNNIILDKLESFYLS